VALVVAAALVVGALIIHGDIDLGGGGGGGSEPAAGKILCAQELVAACEVLKRDAGVDFDVEPAGTTLATLKSAADSSAFPYDGWLTFSRDAEIARDVRDRGNLSPILGTPLGPIARSPLVLTVWNDRAAVLKQRCNDTITWKCVGDVAGKGWSTIGGQGAWGDVKVGHADPNATAEGLAVIGQEAVQYFGRSGLSTDDFDDDAFYSWFTQLEQAVPVGGGVGDTSDFATMLAAGPSVFDVVGTTEAEAGPLLASAARDRRAALSLLYPAPVATADVVFAPVESRDTDVRDTVTGDDGRAALAKAGFRVDGEDRAPGVPDKPALPNKSGLPDAGSLEALLTTWEGITG